MFNRIICMFRKHEWEEWKPSLIKPFKTRKCERCELIEIDPPLPDEFVMSCLEEIERNEKR